MADTNYTKYRSLEDHFHKHMQYDPETGRVTWKAQDRFRRSKIGGDVGCITADGYRQGCIKNCSVYMHIVAWYLARGEWPNGFVDHINGDRSDNRLVNLRVVSHAANIQNQRRANRRNQLGVLGVSRSGDRYRANIRVRGINHSLGSFSTQEEAHAAYLEAKRRLHEGCTI